MLLSRSQNRGLPKFHLAEGIQLQVLFQPQHRFKVDVVLRGAPGDEVLRHFRVAIAKLDVFLGADPIGESANAPGIGVISPSEMKDLTGKADSGDTYNSASRTVLFNSEIYYSQTLPFIYFQSNYLHEAGNVLSIEKYASPTAVGGRYGYKYPDDPDSGASYERCIFGQRMQIP